MLGTKYTVKKGDTLWDISKKHLGDPLKWNKIYEHNNRFDVVNAAQSKIVNPDLIFVNQVIYIPKPTTAKIIKPPLPAATNPLSAKVKARPQIRSVPFQYQLDQIPKITVVSPTYVAVLTLSGSLTLQSKETIDFVTLNKSGFDVSAKIKADNVLSKLLADTKIGYNAKTKSINFENGITINAKNKFSPSITVSTGISTQTQLPYVKATIKAPPVKGELNQHSYITSNLSISIEITPNQPTTANSTPNLSTANSEPMLTGNPLSNNTSRDSEWNFLVGSALIVGAGLIVAATIVEDVITGGAGVADDPVSFALAAGMLARGTLLLKKITTGASIIIEGAAVAAAGGNMLTN